MSSEAAKYLGTSDDVTTCDCCGRFDLKTTVALILPGESEPVYYGVGCAAHALKVPSKDVKKGARDADRAAASVKAEADRKVATAEDARWQAFLNAACPQYARSFMGGPDRFKQLDALGGYAEAKALYRAGKIKESP